MKHLIITGDDFGASSPVNEAVERLHQGGVLTQAGLMVGSPAADEAVRIARRNPQLCIGLHLVLCERRPAVFGLRCVWDARMRAGLDGCIREQFQRFVELGLEPVWWDGHMHLHLHPTVLALALPVAARLGFHAVRLVREPAAGHVLALIFRKLSARAVPLLDRHAMVACDQTRGLVDTGRMCADRFCAQLARLPDGWTELYFHPGTPAENWPASSVTDALAASGARLCSARDLVRWRSVSVTPMAAGRDR